MKKPEQGDPRAGAEQAAKAIGKSAAAGKGSNARARRTSGQSSAIGSGATVKTKPPATKRS